MDIQAEKIELIKLIADTESEKILKKIKSILTQVAAKAAKTNYFQLF